MQGELRIKWNKNIFLQQKQYAISKYANYVSEMSFKMFKHLITDHDEAVFYRFK